MASKEELKDAVLREINEWQGNPGPYAFNTGYGGRHVPSEESVSEAVFLEVAAEIKAYVETYIAKHGVRTAKSFSGSEHNEWSILIEGWGKPRPDFNFHIRISS